MLDAELEAVAGVLAEHGGRTGERQHHPDLDRLRLSAGGRERERARKSCGCEKPTHDYPSLPGGYCPLF